MVHIELTQGLEARLATIAQHDGISLDQATLRALETFVQDREDSIEADEIMSRNEPLIPWTEAKQSLGLDR